MISIIVPIYNSEQYLVRCIESVLKQTYQDFELLLIDDGSTDSSFSICRRYAVLDTRVRIFRLSNGGVSRARNYGLSKVVGDWITFLDSDDWLSNDYLEVLQENANRETLNIVQAYVTSLDVVQAWPIKFDCGCFNWSENSTIDNVLVYGTPWGKLYNKQIILSNKIQFDESVSNHEDHLFYFTYLLHVERIHIFNRGCYYYRISRESSLSRKMPDYRALLYVYKRLRAIYDQILSQNQLEYLKLPCMRHFMVYIKIKAIRSAFYNRNTRIERIQVLSQLSRKEIFTDYQCMSLNNVIMKAVLLMPNLIRVPLLQLFRMHLK